MRHSAFDKKYLSSGAIYTQGVNRTDFTDPITVVYGHNGYKETMFTTLHKFEDSDFFNSHEYFYIYMPQHKLTYQIISAFKYDDRHIMNSFNFYDENDLANFQAEITNPSSALKNVRTNLDTTIDKDSKIVVLSTCITNQKSNRFLVCGVLVKMRKQIDPNLSGSADELLFMGAQEAPLAESHESTEPFKIQESEADEASSSGDFSADGQHHHHSSSASHSHHHSSGSSHGSHHHSRHHHHSKEEFPFGHAFL